MGMVFGRTGISADNGLSPLFALLASRPCGIEIRRYPSFLVAEVASASEKDDAEAADRDRRATAFNLLAKYIGVMSTPENEPAEAISMTAPVLMEPAPEKIAMTAPVMMESRANTGTMAFVMPNKYTSLDQLPKPKNDRIKLKEVPATTVLCLTWYGRVRDGGLAKLKEMVELCVKDTLLTNLVKPEPTANSWRLCGYTPPFTLPPWQKQEVHIMLPQEVTEERVAALLKQDEERAAAEAAAKEQERPAEATK